MQLNKSFLAIGYGQTDRITDICDSRVAFATEKSQGNDCLGCCSRFSPTLTYSQIHGSWWLNEAFETQGAVLDSAGPEDSEHPLKVEFDKDLAEILKVEHKSCHHKIFQLQN